MGSTKRYSIAIVEVPLFTHIYSKNNEAPQRKPHHVLMDILQQAVAFYKGFGVLD